MLITYLGRNCRRRMRYLVNGDVEIIFSKHAEDQCKNRGRSPENVIVSMSGLRTSEWRRKAGVVAHCRKGSGRWIIKIITVWNPGLIESPYREENHDGQCHWNECESWAEDR